MVDEFELLKAWKGGDKSAGKALVERHYDALSRFFHSKARDGASDLIQRAFLVTLETHARMREGTTFKAYLFGVARIVLLEHYRDRRRDTDRFDPETQSFEDLAPSPTGLQAAADEKRLVLHALRRIPLRSQMLLELYFWEDMTAKDIGDALDAPEGTIRTWIRRARQELEAQIAALTATPGLLHSTLSDLEGWARRLRDDIPRKP